MDTLPLPESVDRCIQAKAAEFLARLPQVFGSQRERFGPRPGDGGTVTTRAIEHGDSEQDTSVRAFDAQGRGPKPIHGNFNAGDLLARSGHAVALLDRTKPYSAGRSESFRGLPDRQGAVGRADE